MFTDLATIRAQAGKGGDGRLSFHSTRGNAKGGPDGGDGGRGGSIILRVSHNTSTLSQYRTSRTWQAHNGDNGGTNKRHGKNGDDIVLMVPPGTTVKDGEEIVADLIEDSDEAVVARGGDGGFGNTHFKSSIRQAPKMAELGEMGQSKELTLELKLVADVGLVGLPNAGKSTLLSMVTNAKPEVADYAFTTLIPNLGVVELGDNNFLLADIPGLIEGASKGKGLGDDFLRHIERCQVIIHLIDINSTDITKDYQTIRDELKDYVVDMSSKPSMVVLTKVETKDAKEAAIIRKTLAKYIGTAIKNIHMISAVTTMGLRDLMHAADKSLVKARAEAKKQAAKDQKEAESEIPVIGLDEKSGWQVEKVGDKYVVSGEEIERFARRTDMSQTDGVRRLRETLRKKGVLKEIGRAGGEKGDIISIVGKDMQW